MFAEKYLRSSLWEARGQILHVHVWTRIGNKPQWTNLISLAQFLIFSAWLQCQPSKGDKHATVIKKRSLYWIKLISEWTVVEVRVLSKKSKRTMSEVYGSRKHTVIWRLCYMCQRSTRMTGITVIYVQGDGLLGFLCTSLSSRSSDSICQSLLPSDLHLSVSQREGSWIYSGKV